MEWLVRDIRGEKGCQDEARSGSCRGGCDGVWSSGRHSGGHEPCYCAFWEGTGGM